MGIASLDDKKGFDMAKFAGLFTGLCLLLFLVLPGPVQSAEEAELMERWLVTDSLSKRTVDHTLWEKFLTSYLTANDAGAVVFDYGAVGDLDLEALTSYIEILSRTDVDRLNRLEQKAFWINAYNAIVVSVALSEYPVKSINDIGGWFLAPGPWQAKRFRVYQINLSLNDIYHRILRPIWNDPRIHYALSCGALGCPAPKATPYKGETIESDLDMAARIFINQGPAILFIKGNGINISRIYDWYEEDFGASDGEILDHIRSLADENLARQLAPVIKISGHGFDWALNDQR